jgi:putative ABC transport system permease protein
MKLSERLYRVLLRLYPREFRDEYGGEMSALFRDRYAHGRLTLWLQVLGDLWFHAPREHWTMFRQDAQYALRSWRRAPAVAAIALTALTFGVGANTAIFSVVYAVLVRPLPVRQPDELMLVQEVRTNPTRETSAASLPNYFSWKERVRGLDLAAFSGQALTWTGIDQPERLDALASTASFLRVIGGTLRSGRWFVDEEERFGRHRVAVLSDRLWRQRFGERPGVLGRELILNGAAYVIIGIASPALSVPSEPDLWVPQVVDATESRRGNRYLSVVGRLQPGFTRDQAQAQLSAVAGDLQREYPDSNRGFDAALVPLAESLIPSEIRAALIVLMAASALVLLIACANVAHVLLSRAATRRKEITIRAALGAGAARLARQLLTESVILSVIGGVCGVILSTGIVNVSRASLVGVVPRVEEVTLNVTVLAIAFGIALVTGVLSGLVPLRHVSGVRTFELVHLAGRDDRVVPRSRIRTALIVSQVALITVLLVGAGLLIQSFDRLQRVPLGMSADSVLTARLSLSRARLPNGAAIGDFMMRLTSALQGGPGIDAAGVSSAIPLSPGAQTTTRVAGEREEFLTSEWRLVDAGYFRTLRIPLVRGRVFGEEDTSASRAVFVISQQTARAVYGDQDPIGRRIRLENGRTGEIVGVVGDVRMRNLNAAPERVVYFLPSQFGFFPLFNVVMRVDGRPESAAAILRSRLKELDPLLAAYDVQPMQHWVDQNSARMRIRAFLIVALGGVALLLGVVGIYGVMSFLVAARTKEFGIRVALGARPSRLPLLVLAQGLRLAVPGVLTGLAVAALVAGRLHDLLYEVDARDPATFAVAALVVSLVAMVASYVPSRRAATADPLVALRGE